jgi:hypothetical protein
MSSFKTKRHFKALGKVCFVENFLKRSRSKDPTLTKHQHMGKAFRDFFDVVSDEHRCWRISTGSKNTESANKILAASKIKSCGWFIEKKKARLGHQGSSQ